MNPEYLVNKITLNQEVKVQQAASRKIQYAIAKFSQAAQADAKTCYN